MKDCTPNGDCHFNKFRRPLYFHGMLLDDKSFRDEQEYHTQKRRLLNRMLYGSGVVCGLAFTNDERTITISCGMALSCEGYEIYVPDDITVPVPVPDKAPKGPCAPPPKDRGKEVCYRIRIAYTEEDTAVEQVLLPGGGCEDKTCKPTRKREGYCIRFDECVCPERKPGDCKDLTSGLVAEYVQCSCGCSCSCGEQHWVSIGSVKVALDGKISGKANYQCRDYVFSPQMLKQLLTKPVAAKADCDCPDQWERLKDLLKLICDDEVKDTIGKKLDEENKSRTDAIYALQTNLEGVKKIVDRLVQEKAVKK